MGEALLRALALSLTVTVLLETCFYLCLIKKRNKKDLLLTVLVNVLTNPAVVLLYWLGILYTDWPRAALLIPLELFAVLTEGYYYNKYGRYFSRPYLFSITANVFSYGVGALLL